MKRHFIAAFFALIVGVVPVATITAGSIIYSLDRNNRFQTEGMRALIELNLKLSAPAGILAGLFTYMGCLTASGKQLDNKHKKMLEAAIKMEEVLPLEQQLSLLENEYSIKKLTNVESLKL